MAGVPATMAFTAGQTSIAIPVTGGPVSSQQTANITASITGIAPATVRVTVNPIGGIQVSNATVGDNQSTTVTITLPGTALAKDVVVTLASGDSNVFTVPSSITIAAGSTPVRRP